MTSGTMVRFAPPELLEWRRRMCRMAAIYSMGSIIAAVHLGDAERSKVTRAEPGWE